ncbi:MAG: HPF/RaiA family ribosome-associated protein [Azoarcus sp.]|jgi:hypothetical protein|nr:HPF/RaiA family ribosome-associated protein [Azoarcus sp.]
MKIDLRCNGASLREYVMQRMGAAMERFRAHIRWARIKVADAQGGADKRCIVQLRLYNLPDVVFAITRLDERAAIDEAAARAARVLAQRLQRGFGGLVPAPSALT